jgi:hypothetical protein
VHRQSPKIPSDSIYKYEVEVVKVVIRPAMLKINTISSDFKVPENILRDFLSVVETVQGITRPHIF